MNWTFRNVNVSLKQFIKTIPTDPINGCKIHSIKWLLKKEKIHQFFCRDTRRTTTHFPVCSHFYFSSVRIAHTLDTHSAWSVWTIWRHWAQTLITWLSQLLFNLLESNFQIKYSFVSQTDMNIWVVSVCISEYACTRWVGTDWWLTLLIDNLTKSKREMKRRRNRMSRWKCVEPHYSYHLQHIQVPSKMCQLQTNNLQFIEYEHRPTERNRIIFAFA